MSAAEKEEALQEQERQRAWAKLGEDFAGRRVLWDILEGCGLLTGSFAVGAPDLTAFNEGRRDIGLRIHRHISPSAFALMQTEAEARAARIERATATDNAVDDGWTEDDDG